MYLHKIQRPIARRLQCDDRRNVKKYLRLLKVQMTEADITEAVTLESNATVPLSDEDAKKNEELDKNHEMYANDREN